MGNLVDEDENYYVKLECRLKWDGAISDIIFLNL